MKKIIGLGFIVFAFSLVIYIPSGIAAKLLPNNIHASEYYGNIWQGSASALTINGFELGTVLWKIKPGCFFTFSLCAQVEQQHEIVSSNFIARLSNNVELHDVTAEGDAVILNAILQNYGLTSSGAFEVDLNKVSFNQNNIDEITGNIKFSSLVLNGVIRVSMGNVDTVIESKDDHTVILIDNNNGHLDLNGEIKLFADMSYHADMRLKQNERTSEMVVNGLSFVGNTEADGSVRVNQKGRLTI